MTYALTKEALEEEIEGIRKRQENREKAGGMYNDL